METIKYVDIAQEIKLDVKEKKVFCNISNKSVPFKDSYICKTADSMADVSRLEL